MRNKRKISFLVLSLAAALLLAGTVRAQTGGGYDLTWWTVDSGGGTVSGGGYALMGTVGQADASAALSGGGYTLMGGFWPGGSTPSVCPAPLLGVTIAGPASGYTGMQYTFTAQPNPVNPTGPVTYTWSTDGLISGQGSSQATFQWDTPGSKSVEVVARNCGGQDYASNLIVAISPGCPNPITGGSIVGAGSGYTGVNYDFSAAPDASATPPFTYTWSSGGLVSGQSTANATYSWAITGAQTLSVTIENCGGSVDVTHSITLTEPPLTCTTPLTEVGLSGPASAQVNEVLTFTASYTPANATLPISYTWLSDGLASGQGTDTAVYHWPIAGQYQVIVSAVNCGGSDNASQVVNITSPATCTVPLAGVDIIGPTSGPPGNYTFAAEISPTTASLPVTYTWSIAGLVSGQGSSQASYTWTTTGAKSISVTATNCGGTVNNSHTVVIGTAPEIWHYIYLPIVVRNS